MKAEHRKELRTNVLADTLGRAIQGVKRGPSRNTVLVGSLVLLAVALFGVWWYFSASAAENDSNRWVQLDSLATPEQLEKFTEDKDLQDSAQVRVANFMLARLKLSQGLRDLVGSLRSRALEDIRKAAQTYEKLAADSRTPALLQQEALLGAAKAYEALGELPTAKGFYQKLKDSHPDSTFGKDAARQLERLETSKDLTEVVKEYGAPGPR
jgi:tetratricopeptide (TPR) repeat protein